MCLYGKSSLNDWQSKKIGFRQEHTHTHTVWIFPAYFCSFSLNLCIYSSYVYSCTVHVYFVCLTLYYLSMLNFIPLRFGSRIEEHAIGSRSALVVGAVAVVTEQEECRKWSNRLNLQLLLLPCILTLLCLLPQPHPLSCPLLELSLLTCLASLFPAISPAFRLLKVILLTVAQILCLVFTHSVPHSRPLCPRIWVPVLRLEPRLLSLLHMIPFTVVKSSNRLWSPVKNNYYFNIIFIIIYFMWDIHACIFTHNIVF